MHLQRWVVIDRDDSKQWNCRLLVWRLQFELFIYRHQYDSSPDRWVLKTGVIYDRK